MKSTHASSVNNSRLYDKTNQRPATTKKINPKIYNTYKRTSFQNNAEYKEPDSLFSNGQRQISEVINNWQPKKPVFELEQYKFCEECQCHLPPRAHHCKKCERCVLRRDHHCSWLGTCIGYYNYKYFILLLYYQSILLSLIIFEAIQELLKGTCMNKAMVIVFMLFCVPELIVVILLCVMHTMLLCRNMTSIERIKRPNYVSKWREQ